MSKPVAARAAPQRSDTQSSGAITDEDLSGTTGLLLERIRAWKHAVSNLVDYVTATEKASRSQSKEYEKILKTIADPIREAHHFDQGAGGVSGLLDSLRLSTQGIVNVHLETEKNLRASVIPSLNRLHDEVKAKEKEVISTAGKGSKQVDKARASTQSHIEALGQHVAAVSSPTHKPDPANDPYVVQRGLYHRLNKQILSENESRTEILAFQDQFAQFETHVMSTLQSALATFVQFVSGQADRQRGLYSDVLAVAQRIPPDFEWGSFVHRNGGVLMDPHSPPRAIANVTFPNQGHVATKPLIEGLLERKSRLMVKSYAQGYYVVTPAKYLHEYKDTDDFKKDPVPELSLYLPDCTVSAKPEGGKFTVKGKDRGKGKMGVKIGGTHELAFKAASQEDAGRWCEVIRSVSGGASDSEPSSPAVGAGGGLPAVQTQGIARADSDEKKTASAGETHAKTPVSAAAVASPAVEKAPVPAAAPATAAAVAAPEEKKSPALVAATTAVEKSSPPPAAPAAAPALAATQQTLPVREAAAIATTAESPVTGTGAKAGGEQVTGVAKAPVES